MKNKRREILAWVGAIAVLSVLLTLPSQFPAIIDWLRHDKPPETEQVAPITVEEVKQQVLLEQVKNAEGHSVLLRTEKIGDNVNPVTVRHYARWTELGEVEYWTEQVKE
ncbi:hypothetical protein NHG23_08575 [Aerococcaceae bacterium NML190073]|nr:hypothetical protein [Aerococcaceae bacterium NML190073]